MTSSKSAVSPPRMRRTSSASSRGPTTSARSVRAFKDGSPSMVGVGTCKKVSPVSPWRRCGLYQVRPHGRCREDPMRQITLAIALLSAFGCKNNTPSFDPAAGSADERAAPAMNHDRDDDRPRRFRLSEGRHIFRFDTFGDEAFWGDTLLLHKAIEGSALGGVGPGVSPKTALAVGLKVDVDALSKATVDALKADKVNLDDPAVTVALLTSNAVVGVTGFSDRKGGLRTLGIQCAFCHSTVDNSLAPGIGHRLDGWPNRDLNVGAIVGLSPDLSAVATLLGVDKETVRNKVLASWGPGKFDAELFLDGKAFRPDGKSAATLIPAAFGLTGVNLHTYTGWGSVPYWNAFVANLEMQGSGRFYDPRLKDTNTFPVAARLGFANVQLRSHRGGPGQSFVCRQGQLRHVPRPSAVYRTGLEYSHAGRNRH